MATKKKGFAREYIETIVIALLLAFGVRTLVVEAFEIPSESMVPTFVVGDRLMVDKAVFRFRKPQRNDILVFTDPEDNSKDLIKRVVGLPGETLDIRNRIVYINGKPLKEDIHAHHEENEFTNMPGRDNFGPVVIPAGNYFMMGDNRENSRDSRFWGYLNENRIIGRAFIIYWSRNQNRAFPSGVRFERFGSLVE